MKQIVKFIIGIMIILFLIYGFQSLSRLEEDVGQSAQEDKKQELFHQNKDVFAWLTVDGPRLTIRLLSTLAMIAIIYLMIWMIIELIMERFSLS